MKRTFQPIYQKETRPAHAIPHLLYVAQTFPLKWDRGLTVVAIVEQITRMAARIDISREPLYPAPRQIKRMWLGADLKF